MKKIRNIISNFLYKMATKIGKTAHIVLFINDYEEAKKLPNETLLEIMNKSANFACSMLSDEIKQARINRKIDMLIPRGREIDRR